MALNLIRKVITKMNIGEPKIKNFGRSDALLLEVHAEHLYAVAFQLRFDENTKFEKMDFLSCYENKGKFYFSYFLSSSLHQQTLVLRTAIVIPEFGKETALFSLADVWSTAIPYEEEIFNLFGVVFLSRDKMSEQKKIDRGLDSFRFPLRKNYVWEDAVL